MITYKIINGTSYDERTQDEVVAKLENARLNRTRLHISMGETEGPNAGRDWLEENDVYGFVGRSTGTVKIPLLVHNRRSLGGAPLLDHCIVRIRSSQGGRILYQHPKYDHGRLEIRPKAEPISLPDGRVLKVEVFRDGKEQSAFESIAQARRYIQKLGVRAEIVA